MATTQPTNAKIEELKARLQLEPTSRLFFPLAEELRKAGRVEEAEKVLREGIDRNPAYLSAWVSLGRVLAQRENHAEAVDAFNRALQLDPENIVAARMSAESHLKLGNKIEAIKKFKLVHAFLPSDQEIQAHIESLERDLNPDRYVRPISLSDSASEFNDYSDQEMPVERDEDLPKTKVLPVVTPPQDAAATAPPEALAAETSAFLADAFGSPERRQPKPEITSIPAATTAEPVMEAAPEPGSDQAVEPFLESIPQFETEPVPAPQDVSEPFAEGSYRPAAEPAAAEPLPAASLAAEEASPTEPAGGKTQSVVKLEKWLGKMRRDHGQRI
jgi:tetratricopeptide (TPR) repeat protein